MKDIMSSVKNLIRESHAWPGGYEKFAIADDGGIICHKCLKSNFALVSHSTRYEYRDEWQIEAISNTSEIGENQCSHCGQNIG